MISKNIEVPKSNEKSPKIVKEFNIELNKDIYILKVGVCSNNEKIYFCVSPENNNILIYDSNYSLNDLYELSKNFKFFNTIKDLINALDDMMNNNKISIEKDEKDVTLLKLVILTTNFMGINEKISIVLKLNVIKEKEGNKYLIKKILELEKILLEKDEEIKVIKNKYNELEKRIINLEKYYSNPKIQSNIVNKNIEYDFILQRLKKLKDITSFDLIYICNDNNDTPKIFHEKCDGIKNVLVIIETTEGARFGGFTSVGFNSNSGETKDNDAFLFSFDKKKIYNIKNDKSAIYCKEDYGPCFCGTLDYNIYIVSNHFLKGECHTSKSSGNNFEIDYDFELNNSKYKFYIKNLEIFKVE
jgi:hypothetical protein